MFFSPFSIAITSFGEERASAFCMFVRFVLSLGAFCTFVRFVLVWFCLFPLPLGVWEELRDVIVALTGLFSYPFSLNPLSDTVCQHMTGRLLTVMLRHPTHCHNMNERLLTLMLNQLSRPDTVTTY